MVQWWFYDMRKAAVLPVKLGYVQLQIDVVKTRREHAIFMQDHGLLDASNNDESRPPTGSPE